MFKKTSDILGSGRSEVRSSRPSSEGGVSEVIRHRDSEGDTRMVSHVVTDNVGNVIHEHFKSDNGYKA